MVMALASTHHSVNQEMKVLGSLVRLPAIEDGQTETGATGHASASEDQHLCPNPHAMPPLS